MDLAVGSEDKSICCQSWWSELNPWEPHGWRKEPTPKLSYNPNMNTVVPAPPHRDIHIHRHTESERYRERNDILKMCNELCQCRNDLCLTWITVTKIEVVSTYIDIATSTYVHWPFANLLDIIWLKGNIWQFNWVETFWNLESQVVMLFLNFPWMVFWKV